MAAYRKISAGEVIMGRAGFGADLLGEITGVCEQNSISLGRVQAIGAVQKAVVGFYNQEKREYAFQTLDTPLEILNLSGNVSLKDGQPFVHAHITLADERGRAFGGHLAEGTIVFACEFEVRVFTGREYKRTFDRETDLALWDLG